MSNLQAFEVCIKSIIATRKKIAQLEQSLENQYETEERFRCALIASGELKPGKTHYGPGYYIALSEYEEIEWGPL